MTQTIRAHRLCRKALDIGGQELQEKFLDVIFKAYFTEVAEKSPIPVIVYNCASAHPFNLTCSLAHSSVTSFPSSPRSERRYQPRLGNNNRARD